MEDGSHSSNRTRGGFLPPRRPMLPMMNPIHPGMMRRHGDQFSANGYNPEAPSFDGQQLPPPLPPWGHPMMPMPPMPGGFGPRFGPRGFMGPYHVPGGPHFDRKRPREQRRSRRSQDSRDGFSTNGVFNAFRRRRVSSQSISSQSIRCLCSLWGLEEPCAKCSESRSRGKFLCEPSHLSYFNPSAASVSDAAKSRARNGSVSKRRI
ncbi:uncharacterized protein [Oscarella lobularis]|uniref:uncharacterized protein n=1 Tax=Oscarella lobularis TaxID=121494 RepID=UPI003313DABE